MGCDALTSREADEARPTAFVRAGSPLVTPAGVAFSRASTELPLDPAIDTGDTYAVTDVLVHQSVETLDGSLQALPTESHRLEAGYTAAGALVYVDYQTEAPGNPVLEPVDEVRTVRMVGTSVTMHRVDGSPVPVDPAETVSLQETIQDAGYVVTDALVLDRAPRDTSVTISPVMGAAAGLPGAGRMTNVQVQARGDGLEVSATLAPGAGPGEAAGPTVRVKRRYRPSGDRYVVASMEQEVRNAQGRVTGRTVTQVVNVRWKNHPEKDRGRRARRGQPRASAAPPLVQASTQGACPVLPSGIPDCPPDCWEAPDGTLQCGDPPPPEVTDPCPPTPESLNSGMHLVFQHGFNSDGAAWRGKMRGDGVRAEARCALRFSSETVHSMSDRARGRHVEQIAELGNEVAPYSGRDMVFITHSQGGVIARRLAQKWDSQNRQSPGSAPKTLAVVTLTTPHNGAAIAGTLPSVVNTVADIANRIAGAVLPIKLSPVVSFLIGGIRVGAPPFDELAVWAAPALPDLQRGSVSLETMNQGTENFRRLGVQSRPPKRWMAFRLRGDGDRKGGGEVRVRKAHTLYASLGSIARAGLFVPIVGWATSALCVVVRTAMNALDLVWHAMASGGEAYDGVVPYSSQLYPNTPGQYLPRNRELVDLPVSHLGMQASDETARIVRREMEQWDEIPQLNR